MGTGSQLLPGDFVAASDSRLAGSPVSDETLKLVLHAEDLAVTKRRMVRTVKVRRETRSRDTLVEEVLTKTGIVIEHVPVGRFIDAVPPVREEGDTTILPVVEEVVVTTRRLRLVEEIHVRRVRSTSNHVETVTLREQHVVVTRSDPVIHEAAASVPVPATPANPTPGEMP